MVPSGASPSPSPFLPLPEPGTDEVVRLCDPGDLVTAVPVLLGFHPRESLVLIATGGPSGRRLELALRVDLPRPEHVAAVCDSAAGSLLAGSPTGAAVIVLGGGPGSGVDPPGRDVADRAIAALDRHRVPVHTAVWAAATGAGSRWACYDECGCAGALPDPGSTPVTAAATAAGQVVYADRGELDRLVAPADPARLGRRDRLLTRAVDAALDGPDPAAADDVAALRAVVHTAVDDAAAGRLHLDDARVVAMAGALVVPAVRDAAMACCAGPRAAAAEQLWAALARETPDPEAAEPAALLAVSALLRGNGALANVALDRAERAWPGHRLTGVLRGAVEVGLRPEQVRACLSLGDDAPTGPVPPRGRPRRRVSRRPAAR